MTDRQRLLVYGAILVLVAVLVFVPAVSGPWIYDDQLLIRDNAYAHTLTWWPRWWMTDFWNIGGEVLPRNAYWRPLVSTSYGIDWQLGGGSPLMFHVTNLLLHAGVAALTFVTLRRWIGSAWPAFVAALLFVVHPTKAESVAWISGRTDVICMLALLVTADGIARRLRRQPGGIALEVFGTLIAYTSKEQAIVLPVFAAVEAWVIAERGAIDWPMLVRMLRTAAPQIAAAVLYLVLRHFLMPIAAPSVGAGIPVGDHIQAVSESMGRFVALTVVPHDLSIQQGLIHISAGKPVHSVGYIVLGALAFVSLVGAAFAFRKRQPFVTIGIGFFLFTIAPTSNIIHTQLETLVSERFLYLPLLGIAYVAGVAIARTQRRWPAYMVLAIALVFSVQSFDRSRDYADEDVFWARERELHPTSPTAQRNAINHALRERHYRAALARTLELTRNDVDYQDVSVALQVAGLVANLTPDHDRATLTAIDQFCQDLLAAKSPAATLTTGAVSFTIPTTTTAFRRYLEIYKTRIIALRAQLQSRLGNNAEAVELAKTALGQCPRCADIVTSGALTIARAGYYDDALELLAESEGHIPVEPLSAMRNMIEKAQAAHEQAAQASGPASIQAHAAELAALELWGRAFDVLAPHEADIMRAPKFARGFAELAVRAGEPIAARRVLAGALSPGEIDQLVAQWSSVMGWTQ
jgi:hypothetical protein